MSSESTFVVNVKTRNGTIITVRGDSFDSLQSNVTAAIAGSINNVVGALEEQILGAETVAASNVEYAKKALGATNTFAPVPPPAQPQAQPQTDGAPAPTCKHGPMVRRTASKGPRKDFWACTAPMNATDKCAIVNI